MSVKKQRKRNRLYGFDYANNGIYFVTICTQKRVRYFGRIYHGVMCINKLGSIVWRQWEWLGRQYPYIVLHTFVVMPNHIHGIIEINRRFVEDYIHFDDIDNGYMQCNGRDRSRPVPTPRASSLLSDVVEPKILSLSNIIGAFKTTTSKKIHEAGFQVFQWQRSFHDHIIRDERSYNKIYQYIGMNPVLWNKDVYCND